MKEFHNFAKLTFLPVVVLLLSAHGSLVNGQNAQPPKPAQDDDVIRVSTALVQTDVMVFDKREKFVEGLKPEQFQVKINGTPVVVSFLEMVTTGSTQEKAQIAAARGGRPATVTGEKTPSPMTVVEGRSLFLFVDDLHLDGESLSRTRKMLSKTVDEMTANDRALVITASGQRLDSNLVLGKAESGREPRPEYEFSEAALRSSLLTLHDLVVRFVENPIFRERGVFDIQETKKAKEDVDDIIALGDQIKKIAKRLRKDASK